MDFGEKNLLDHLARHGLGTLTLVVAPRVLFLQALENVQDGGVLLTVVLVERGQAVVGEDVVDEAAALRHVRLRSVVPALDEELFHVLVGDELLRGYELRTSWGPPEFVAGRELPCVQ